MKKIITLISLVTIIFASCNKSSYSIDGQFSDNTYDGKTVYIYHVEEDSTGTPQPVVLDSAVVKDKTFKINGTAPEEVGLGVLLVGKIEEFAMYDPTAFAPVNFVLEPGNIKFTSDANRQITLAGTPRNEEMNKVYAHTNKLNVIQKEIINSGKTGEEAMMEYQQRAEPLTKDLQTATYDFTKANMANKVGEYYFMMAAQNTFTLEQINELIQLADTAFQNKENIKNFIAAINRPIPNEGNPYADARLMDTNGNAVALSDYVGKNKCVLVDFWASWCGPCIQEMPSLVKMYNMYKPKGLEIVGISVDDDKTKWLDAIKTHKMSWVQLADASTEASEIYNVQTIPHTILIDQNGTIVAKNLRGQELENKIAEILK